MRRRREKKKQDVDITSLLSVSLSYLFLSVVSALNKKTDANICKALED